MRPYAPVRRATRSAAPASLPAVPLPGALLAEVPTNGAAPLTVVFPPTDPTRTEAV
ncbi:hypothetical protein ACFU5Y_19085 [Streptomyces gardneri]|uniref:hypothetical protein n=1 Tax=Streptomyces gardneri TaxID=66892 RepID=UPI0036AA8C9D